MNDACFLDRPLYALLISMKPETHNYYAFLLRLWRENGRAPWRAALENPHTGEKHTFSSPEQLWTYVETQIDPSITVLASPTATTTDLEADESGLLENSRF